MKRNLYIVQLVLILNLCSFVFAAGAQVKGVAAVGMTVSDMDRATDFYSALTFQKVSDIEVFGDEYEHLVGIFGARMRPNRRRMSVAALQTSMWEYCSPVIRAPPVRLQERARSQA